MNTWPLRSSVTFQGLLELEDRQRASVLIYALQVSQGYYLELHENPKVTERTSEILYAFELKWRAFASPLPYASKHFFSLPNCFQVQCTMEWYQRSLMQQPSSRRNSKTTMVYVWTSPALGCRNFHYLYRHHATRICWNSFIIFQNPLIIA